MREFLHWWYVTLTASGAVYFFAIFVKNRFFDKPPIHDEFWFLVMDHVPGIIATILAAVFIILMRG